MFRLLQKLFSRPKRGGGQRPLPTATERFDRALARCRDRLQKFLVTRSVETGTVKKTARWTMVKSNPGLYRLEGEQCSILINTEPFLVRREGKIQGLLRMSESELCRALEEEGGLDGFLRRSEPLPPHSRKLRDEIFSTGDTVSDGFDDQPGLPDLREWSKFAIDRMITTHSVNTLALVLVSSDPQTESVIRQRLSNRLEETLIGELEALAGEGSRPELNPHSRVRPLFDFEEALTEFRRGMQRYKREEFIRNIEENRLSSTGRNR